MNEQDPCVTCDGKCCGYFCFEIDEPAGFEEFDDIRWYVLHEGVTVHIDDGDWYISIENRCRALDSGNRCTIYAERPIICRKYSRADCDHTEGDYEYEAVFATPEDVEKYARKKLGRKKYDEARAKAHAKADKKDRKRRKHMMEAHKHHR